MTDKNVVLITGGSKGIGLETAKKFGENGYCLAINDFDKTGGKETVKSLQACGYTASFHYADVTKEDEVNQMVASVINDYGRIDALINNAGGLGGRSPIAEMSTNHWDRVLDLNLRNPFFVTRAVIPHMERTGGTMVNITSIAAYNGGGPGASAYAVAKAGVLAFTRAAAKELISKNIRVNAISPGTIDTAFHSATAKEIIDSWKQQIPAGRLGRPEEVANVIWFLCSEQSSYLVGEVIQINGAQAFV